MPAPYTHMVSWLVYLYFSFSLAGSGGVKCGPTQLANGLCLSIKAELNICNWIGEGLRKMSLPGEDSRPIREGLVGTEMEDGTLGCPLSHLDW